MTNKNKNWSVKNNLIPASVILVVGIVIFTVAFISMAKHIWLYDLNNPILNWMIDNRNQNLTNIMKIISSVLSPLNVSFVMFLIAVFWFVKSKNIWAPFLLFIAIIDTALLTKIFKTITSNPRPLPENMILPLETDFSFPSGHVITLFVLTLVLGYLIYSRKRKKTMMFFWVSLSSFMAISMIISRLYLGYHWFTDVTASIGLGLVIISLTIFADILFQNNIKAKSSDTDQ